MKLKRKQAPLRLHIDWTRCDGRGLCAELLPELLARDDWGYPLAPDGSREPLIRHHAQTYARAAVSRCPRLALSLLPRSSD
jgi:ferredoxin